jgi:hypothetical protein
VVVGLLGNNTQPTKVKRESKREGREQESEREKVRE